eukprot:CAMPEP_0198213630 /NCGR_PEP_ID=MMETSP1445-20131203/28977_1 /TAXON_ID=36898 /ORGANISM="Pyramimonas sp., Strain CCMP2087" /LENGTH=314 /DNA_ID=CAMNT_0043888301 /DNA_START=425 /DNA_END=1369 /DNA_ORIENTATION=-
MARLQQDPPGSRHFVAVQGLDEGSLTVDFNIVEDGVQVAEGREAEEEEDEEQGSIDSSRDSERFASRRGLLAQQHFPPANDHETAGTSHSGATEEVLSTPSESMVCRVPGCTTSDMQWTKYSRKHRVCMRHIKLESVLIDDIKQRFCQKCTRFQRLEDFDGSKHTCRKGLESQRQRRLMKIGKLDPDVDVGPVAGTKSNARKRGARKIEGGGREEKKESKEGENVKLEKQTAAKRRGSLGLSELPVVPAHSELSVSKEPLVTTSVPRASEERDWQNGELTTAFNDMFDKVDAESDLRLQNELVRSFSVAEHIDG